MVLSILVGVSTLFGASEAIKNTQSKARRDEHRTRKSNLVVKCGKSSQFSSTLDGKRVVLSGDKLYIDTGTHYDQPFGHPFTGYYLPYPDAKYAGLVSTIHDGPPVMNWIYVDRDSYELKFGTRPYAEYQLNGPWDCTRQEKRLTFGGWEGFVVVQEGQFWAVYFDKDNDLLKGRVPEGTVVLEIDLVRREMRGKPAPTAEARGDGDAEKTAEKTGDAKTDEKSAERG